MKKSFSKISVKTLKKNNNSNSSEYKHSWTEIRLSTFVSLVINNGKPGVVIKIIHTPLRLQTAYNYFVVFIYYLW